MLHCVALCCIAIVQIILVCVVGTQRKHEGSPSLSFVCALVLGVFETRNSARIVDRSRGVRIQQSMVRSWYHNTIRRAEDDEAACVRSSGMRIDWFVRAFVCICRVKAERKQRDEITTENPSIHFRPSIHGIYHRQNRRCRRKQKQETNENNELFASCILSRHIASNPITSRTPGWEPQHFASVGRHVTSQHGTARWFNPIQQLSFVPSINRLTTRS